MKPRYGQIPTVSLSIHPRVLQDGVSQEVTKQSDVRSTDAIPKHLWTKEAEKLYAAKEKEDVAKITQAYLDRLIDFVKTNPKSQGVPDAMRQIAFAYESQGKTVEAGAWREKLLKEHPKASIGTDRGIGN